MRWPKSSRKRPARAPPHGVAPCLVRPAATEGESVPSPFPGMDPYIEACGLWEDFHGRLIHKIDETLARMVPPGYFVSTGVRAYVVLADPEGKAAHVAKPD